MSEQQNVEKEARCTCANDGSAVRCPHHSEADFQAARRSDVERDTAYCNVPMTGRRARSLEAEINRHVLEQRRAKAEEERALTERRKEAREAERNRAKFTAADLAGAEAVRDDSGWHRVVRISAKSVTVATPYSWTERIPIERITHAAIGGVAVTPSSTPEPTDDEVDFPSEVARALHEDERADR